MSQSGENGMDGPTDSIDRAPPAESQVHKSSLS